MTQPIESRTRQAPGKEPFLAIQKEIRDSLPLNLENVIQALESRRYHVGLCHSGFSFGEVNLHISHQANLVPNAIYPNDKIHPDGAHPKERALGHPDIVLNAIIRKRNPFSPENSPEDFFADLVFWKVAIPGENHTRRSLKTRGPEETIEALEAFDYHCHLFISPKIDRKTKKIKPIEPEDYFTYLLHVTHKQNLPPPDLSNAYLDPLLRQPDFILATTGFQDFRPWSVPGAC